MQRLSINRSRILRAARLQLTADTSETLEIFSLLIAYFELLLYSLLPSSPFYFEIFINYEIRFHVCPLRLF